MNLIQLPVEELRCFFINIFNVLVLHARITSKAPASDAHVVPRCSFFRNTSYQVTLSPEAFPTTAPHPSSLAPRPPTPRPPLALTLALRCTPSPSLLPLSSSSLPPRSPLPSASPGRCSRPRMGQGDAAGREGSGRASFPKSGPFLEVYWAAKGWV